jgi:hypothetical protein
MKRFVLVMAAITFAGAALIAGAGRAQESGKVRAEGCVEPGVEAGCLVVKDVKSGKLYNVMIKKPRPEIGAGIEFTGVLHDGLTVCMQGIAVEVTTWAPKNSLNCAKSEPPKE